jgi:hypothetical protein
LEVAKAEGLATPLGGREILDALSRMRMRSGIKYFFLLRAFGKA